MKKLPPSTGRVNAAFIRMSAAKRAALLLAALFTFSAYAQYPIVIWSKPMPNTVSGVAVDNLSGFIATSCFDGTTRVHDQGGTLMASTFIGGAPNAVAFNDGFVATSRTNEFAVGVAPGGIPVYPTSVPATATVRDFSRSAKFAVSQDNNVYNLQTGQHWWSRNYNQFAWLFGCAEDASDASVWTCDLDGIIQKWTGTGELLFSFALGEPAYSLDVSTNKIVITSDTGIQVRDKATGNLLVKALEASLVVQAKFLPDGSIVYGTAGDSGARLVRWDGYSVTAGPPYGGNPTKPPKGKGPRTK